MEKGEKFWISIDLPDKTAGLKIKKEKKEYQWVSQKQPAQARGASVMGKQCGLQSVFLDNTLG